MTLATEIAEVRKSVVGWGNTCVAQAENLVDNFRHERIGLQRAWFADMAEKPGSRASHSIGTWCPLNLFARLHHESLQIYWQLVYRDRVTRSIGYKHLAKKTTGGYDLRRLLPHANSFERDLVAEYEEEAELQRQRWARLTRLRQHLDRMALANGVEGVLMKRLLPERQALGQ